MNKKTFEDFEEFVELRNRSNSLISRFQQYCDFYLQTKQLDALSKFICDLGLALDDFVVDYTNGLPDKPNDDR